VLEESLLSDSLLVNSRYEQESLRNKVFRATEGKLHERLLDDSLKNISSTNAKPLSLTRQGSNSHPDKENFKDSSLKSLIISRPKVFSARTNSQGDKEKN
jgi:hypothetical protein